MNSKLMKLLFTITFISLVMSCSIGQNFQAKRIAKYERIIDTIRIDKSIKKQELNLINNGAVNFKPKVNFTDSKTGEILLLKNEYNFITYQISNITSNKIKLVLSTNLTEKNKFAFFEQAQLNDWYSSSIYKDDINIFGDPLIELSKSDKGESKLLLDSNEAKVVTLYFFTNDRVNDEIILNIKNKSVNKSVKTNVKFINENVPKSNFNSIAFNSINASVGNDLVDLFKRNNHTHLQVNYIPFMLFDKRGNKLSGIDDGNPNTKGFRDTAVNWVRAKGKILLFWEPRVDRLAPMKDGKYIKPFTKPWYNAYKNLMLELMVYLKKYNPEITKEDVLIYMADEVSSTLKNKDYTGFQKLTKHLKKELPQIKILTTFGSYSTINDFKTLEKSDIYIPHYTQKDEIKRGNLTYFPKQTLVEINKKTDKKKWTYLVARGKTENLSSFYIYPILATLKGYEGFSWYSFLDHKGSSWIANDKKRLDYSLVYIREPKNKIYQALHNNTTSKSNYYIPSIRLISAGQGLTNASLLFYILNNENKLSKNNKKKLDRLVYSLNLIENNSEFLQENFSFADIRDIENKLRELYASILNK